MNLVSGILISLWTAGWLVAMVRAGVKARAVATAEPSVKK
jgi:hypothetical protein